MEKRVFFMVTLLVTAGMAMAQGQGPRGGKGEKQDPKVQAERRTERMAKELSLNDTQKQQVLELNLAQAQQRAECKPTTPPTEGEKPAKPTAEEREKFSKEREAQCAAYDAKLKTILTPEQYTKFTEQKASCDKKGKGGKDKKKGGERKQKNS